MLDFCIDCLVGSCDHLTTPPCNVPSTAPAVGVGLEQYLSPPTPQQWLLDDPTLLNRLNFARHLADQLRYEEGLALA